VKELGGEGKEEGGGEGMGALFNVLPPGATDVVAPLYEIQRVIGPKSRNFIPHLYLAPPHRVTPSEFREDF